MSRRRARRRPSRGRARRSAACRPTATSSSSPRSASPSSSSSDDLAGVAARGARSPWRRCARRRRGSRSAVGDLLAGERLLAASSRSVASTSVTLGAEGGPRLRQLDADDPAAEDQQRLRDRASRSSPRGWSTARDLGEPVDRRHRRGRAGRDHDRAWRAVSASSPTRDAALAVERRAAADELDPALLEPGQLAESSRSWITSSRRARTGSTSSSPPTARRAPGTRRASASSSPGRSSAFDGMQA